VHGAAERREEHLVHKRAHVPASRARRRGRATEDSGGPAARACAGRRAHGAGSRVALLRHASMDQYSGT
jgi:hypothetical protein